MGKLSLKSLIRFLPILIPLIWFMRTGSRGISYWLNPEAGMDSEVDYIKGSPIDRMFLVVLEVIGAIILMTRKINWKRFFKENIWLIILYAYMGTSVIWSGFPDVSFKRWVRTCGDLIMVMILITDLYYTVAIKKVIRYGIYILIPLSVLFIKYFRDLGVAYDYTGAMEMWIGVSTHKNSLGQLACISAAFFIWMFFSKYYKWKLWDIPVLLMSLWLLNGSSSATSRTSLGVFFLAVALLFLILSIKNNINMLKITLGILIPCVLVGYLFTEFIFSRNLFAWIITATGGDPTLTGRTELWEAVVKIASDNQPFGTGYGSFWIGGLANNLWDTFSWHPGQSHNGYIDVYVDIGIVGLTLLIILIISVYKNIFEMLSTNSDFGRFRMIFFTMILFYNITESSFVKPTSLLWFLFLLVSIKVPEKFPEYNLKLERELQKNESESVLQR